jgi:hypothetical protein
MPAHAIAMDKDLEPCLVDQGAPGEIVKWQANPCLVSPGPLLRIAYACATKNVKHSVQERTKPKNDHRYVGKWMKFKSKTDKTMEEKVLEFNPQKPVAKRFKKFIRYGRRKVFGMAGQDDKGREIPADTRPLDASYAHLNINPAEVMGPLGDRAEGKCPIQELIRQIELIALLKDPTQFELRVSNGKWEIFDKKNKTVRAVIDNGFTFFTLMVQMGRIVEDLTYGHNGVFKKLSIKHCVREQEVPRWAHVEVNKMKSQMDVEMEKALGEGAFSERPIFGWEIDQTNMEAHTRSPGVMKELIPIWQHVIDYLITKHDGWLAERLKLRLDYDHKKGMRIRMTLNDVINPSKTKQVRLAFADFYLDSGFLLTSWINFIDELAATLSSVTNNPHHIFAEEFPPKDPKGANMSAAQWVQRFRVMKDTGEKGAFDWKFEAPAMLKERFIPGETNPYNEEELFAEADGFVIVRIKIEGDDGAGGLGFSIEIDHEIIKDTVAWYMADLGFCAKFVIVRNGRLEFCGLHMKWANNGIDLNVPVVPALARYLGKFGAHAQSQMTMTTEQRLATAGLRMLSLGCLFRRNIVQFEQAFVNIARRLNNKLSETDQFEIMVKVHAWSCESGAFGDHGSVHVVGDNAEISLGAAFKSYEGLDDPYADMCGLNRPFHAYNAHEGFLLAIANSLETNIGDAEGEVGRDTLTRLQAWSDSMTEFEDDATVQQLLLPICFLWKDIK